MTVLYLLNKVVNSEMDVMFHYPVDGGARCVWSASLFNLTH